VSSVPEEYFTKQEDRYDTPPHDEESHGNPATETSKETKKSR
jgi:hypothetical protein